MKLGITEIDNHTYHHGDGFRQLMGSSGLKKLRKSAAHYQAWIGSEPDDPSAALNFGLAYHIYILERHKFNDKVILGLDHGRRKNVEKEAWAKFEAENKGKVIISKKELETLEAMAEGIHNHATASAILKNPGKAEQTLIWENEFNGQKFHCKARPDYTIFNLEIIVDLKSAVDASPAGFGKACGNYHYDLSAAWYLDGARAALGGDYPTYLFLVQEKEPPYAVAIYRATQDILDNGRVKIAEALDTYTNAVEGDVWPGYPDEVMDLFMPTWAMIK